MRCIGNMRFNIGANLEYFKKKAYVGCLTFKQENGQFRKITGRFFTFMGRTSYASSTTKSSPKSLMTDGYIYISYILDDVNRIELAATMLGLEDGSFIEHEKVHYIKT